jgi:import inner membrane translocase subunit TIM23
MGQVFGEFANVLCSIQKEKEFFDRIRRFRVDPSTNSIANPVPDYYGEKIGSVQGYRQWLKDQRAYNRKRRNFIV